MQNGYIIPISQGEIISIQTLVGSRMFGNLQELTGGRNVDIMHTNIDTRNPFSFDDKIVENYVRQNITNTMGNFMVKYYDTKKDTLYYITKNSVNFGSSIYYSICDKTVYGHNKQNVAKTFIQVHPLTWLAIGVGTISTIMCMN